MSAEEEGLNWLKIIILFVIGLALMLALGQKLIGSITSIILQP